MMDQLPVIGSDLLSGLAGSATTLFGVLIYSQIKSTGKSFVGDKVSQEATEFKIDSDDDLRDGVRVEFHAYNVEGVYRGVNNHIHVETDNGRMAHIPLDAYDKRWDSWPSDDGDGGDS